QLVEELNSQLRLLVLVPLVRRRDVEIDSRLGRPADTRSPMRVDQAIANVTGRPPAAGGSAILGQTFFRKDQMRLWHRDFTRPLGDAVPQSLQIADLFILR